MNRRQFASTLGAAVAGIVAGKALLADDRAAKEAGKESTCAGKNDCKGKGGCHTAKHACAGHNACKGQGGCASTAAARKEATGKNACKGQGGCKTADHACAGHNDCKGKGGCAAPAKKTAAPAKS